MNIDDKLIHTVTIMETTERDKFGSYTLVESDRLGCFMFESTRYIPSRDGLGESLTISHTMVANARLRDGEIIKYEDKYLKIVSSSTIVGPDGVVACTHLCQNYVV